MSLIFEDKNNRLKNVSERMIAAVAYEALQKYCITALPSMTLEYALELNKWKNFKVVSIQEFCVQMCFNLDEWLNDCDGYGFIYYCLEWDCYAIFYNAELPTDLLNWVLATALGYIEFGLVEVGQSQNISEQDVIENFCFYFTAPDPILIECNIRTSKQIIDVCQIPFQKAFRKSKVLKLHNGMAMEESIKKLFSKFIEKFKMI